MRKAFSILAIHPSFPLLMSVVFLASAIFSAVLFSSLNVIIEPTFSERSSDEDLRSGTVVLQLLMGKPWLAFIVGATVGLVAFCVEKRTLRRNIEAPGNIERLAQWFDLPGSDRRKRRRECWGPFQIYRPVLLGILVALILGFVFRCSWNLCICAIGVPWAVLCPEYHRIYEGVLAKMANSESGDSSARNNCRGLRKRARMLMAGHALVVACVGIFLVYYMWMRAPVMHDIKASLITLSGVHLSGEEVLELEERLSRDPEDLSSRMQLLGYYMTKQYESEAARQPHAKHALWFIRNRPAHPVAGNPEVRLDPERDGQAYHQAAKLWQQHVGVFGDNVAVLANAAAFFTLHEPHRAEQYLRKCEALEPKNPEWPDRLQSLLSLGLHNEAR